jgi:hypothetical protein
LNLRSADGSQLLGATGDQLRRIDWPRRILSWSRRREKRKKNAQENDGFHNGEIHFEQG